MVLIITIVLLDVIVLFCVYNYFKRKSRDVFILSRTRLLYARFLIEQVYIYSHAPDTLLKHLKVEMSIKKLLAYHVVDDHCEKFFSNVEKINKNDQLLYQLHKDGFSAQELCVIFGLNNLNSVYVKCHRVNRKLNPKQALPDSEQQQ